MPIDTLTIGTARANPALTDLANLSFLDVLRLVGWAGKSLEYGFKRPNLLLPPGEYKGGEICSTEAPLLQLLLYCTDADGVLHIDCATFAVFFDMARYKLKNPGAKVAGLELPLKSTPLAQKEPPGIQRLKKQCAPYDTQEKMRRWFHNPETIICLRSPPRTDFHRHLWLVRDDTAPNIYSALFPAPHGIVKQSLAQWVEMWGKGTEIWR